MMTRRDLLATALHASTLAGAATLLAPAGALAATAAPLSWRAFPAGEAGFFRGPVLLSGSREAILIDGGFTLSDGKALAEAIGAAIKPSAVAEATMDLANLIVISLPLKIHGPRTRKLRPCPKVPNNGKKFVAPIQAFDA